MREFIKKMLPKIVWFKKEKNQYRKGAIQLRTAPGCKDPRESRPDYKPHLRKFFGKLSRQKSKPAFKSPKKSRKQLFRLLGIGCFTIVFVVVLFSAGREKLFSNLSGFSFFSVSKISFSGNSLVSQEELREVSGIILYQTNLFALDCSVVEQKIAGIPWIAQAKVTRNWPATV